MVGTPFMPEDLGDVSFRDLQWVEIQHWMSLTHRDQAEDEGEEVKRGSHGDPDQADDGELSWTW